MESDFKYRKILVHSVSSKDKKELGSFLREIPLNEKKLANFAQNSVLPDTYRTLVWKVLLNITPRYAESHSYVRQQQDLVYEDLWRTLKVLRLRIPIALSNGEYSGVSNGSNGKLADVQNPEPEHYLLMWLISEAKLLHDPISQMRCDENRGYIIIAHRLSTFFDHPVEFFHFYSALWSLLQKNKEAILDAYNDAIALLKKKNGNLHLHLLRVGLFGSNIMKNHCLSLFCDIFPESAVEKILDKIIAGAFKITTYVVVSLLSHMEQSLLTADNVERIRNCFIQLRKEEADLIVQKALTHWNSRNSPRK